MCGFVAQDSLPVVREHLRKFVGGHLQKGGSRRAHHQHHQRYGARQVGHEKALRSMRTLTTLVLRCLWKPKDERCAHHKTKTNDVKVVLVRANPIPRQEAGSDGNHAGGSDGGIKKRGIVPHAGGRHRLW